MMCAKCGNTLATTARFCGKCGTVVFSQEIETETAVLAPARMAAVLTPPAGAPPRMVAMAPPAGPPPGMPMRPPAQANTGLVICLCALGALALALSAFLAYKKLGGGSSGSAESATTSRVYFLMSMDTAAERTRATGERDVMPVVAVSDGLAELVPYAEGWGLPMTWSNASTLMTGNLPECMVLTRNRTDSMWVHRDGRMIKSPEAVPLGCKGTLMPAHAAKGGGLCGYADGATLKFRIQPAFQSCEPFADGRALVTKEGKAQFIDTTGNTVIQPKFYAANSFSEGLAAVRSQEQNRTGYIDQAGNYVIKARFRVGTDFREGLAAVEMEPSGLLGFIDKSGHTVIQPAYSAVVSGFADGRAVVKKADQLLLIDRSGRELAQWSENRSIHALGEGMYAVKFDDSAQVIDRNGKTVTQGTYKDIYPYQFGYAVAMGNQQTFLLDRSGKEVLRPGKQMLGTYGGRYLTRINPEGPYLDLIDLTGTPRLRLQKGVLTRSPKP